MMEGSGNTSDADPPHDEPIVSPRRSVGRYEIIRQIGRGGMSVVYLAHQHSLDRDVALKELGTFHLQEPEMAQRFLRESRLAGSLNHPNIVTVLEYFEEAGVPYIAMEYLPRGSLRPYVGRLTLPQLAGVMEGVLAGLTHAQAYGIVHRDLKPENLMVTGDGRIKITDYGIAKATQNAATGMFMSATGTTIGTPTYMAPEQAMGQEIGIHTDLYSVGIMAWEHSVGRPPFGDSEAPLVILNRHVNDQIPSATSENPNVDPGLSDWIDRLIVKDPAQRVRDPTQAWDELEEIVITHSGPRWRRNARLPSMGTVLNTPKPLTPAPFDSQRSATPEPITPVTPLTSPNADYQTFDPSSEAQTPPLPVPPAATPDRDAEPEAPERASDLEATDSDRGEPAPSSEEPIQSEFVTFEPSGRPAVDRTPEPADDGAEPRGQPEPLAEPESANESAAEATPDPEITWAPSADVAAALREWESADAQAEPLPITEPMPESNATPERDEAPEPEALERASDLEAADDRGRNQPVPSSEQPIESEFVTFEPSGRPAVGRTPEPSDDEPEAQPQPEPVVEPESSDEFGAEAIPDPGITWAPSADVGAKLREPESAGGQPEAAAIPLTDPAPKLPDTEPNREPVAPDDRASERDPAPKPKPKPVHTSSEEPIRRSGRVGRLIGVTAVAAIVAAAAGFLLAPSKKHATVTTTPLTAGVGSGSFKLSIPARWRESSAATPGYLKLNEPITVQAGDASGGTLVVGTAATPTAKLLPASLTSRLSGDLTPEVVTMGGHHFYRYRGLKPAGADGRVSVYSLPTTEGTVIAACLLPGATGNFAAVCERAVGTLQVTHGKVTGLGPSKTFAAALAGGASRLNRKLAPAEHQLATAKSQKAQSQAAATLAAAYAASAHELQQLKPPINAATAKADLRAALIATASAYAALGEAAAHNQPKAYANARLRLSKGQAAIRAAYSELSRLGYSVGG
jgi:serine/threonine protein kinase